MNLVMSKITDSKQFPGHTDEARPEVFNTIPPQLGPLKTGQLSEEKLKQFFTDGYLIIEDFFDKSALDACKNDVEILVDELAEKLYKGGKITNKHSECGLYERLIKLDEQFPGANILLHKTGTLPQSLRDIWSHEKCLNLAEQILGTSDIAGHPVWNLRTKTPRNDASTVPWHQDVAYLDTGSYDILQLTAWIPLIDATETNGCLQMIRSGHKTGKVADHECCWAGTWYVMMVEDDLANKLECDPVKDLVTCPVPYGGILIFNNMIPHRSLDNLSKEVRWSLDFRWQSAKYPAHFHGLKECVQMRSSTDPSFKIDWESFNAVNRHQQALHLHGYKEEDFDTRIVAPFMYSWAITNKNRHNEALPADQSTMSTWHNVPIVG